MANSPDDSKLLALPRELRDKIYYHYLKVEGGYVYDFESGKLGCVTSAGARRPIDLALMLSCQQIAAEMEGLALKTNTLTFTSVAPDAKQENIHYFHWRMKEWWDETFDCLFEKDFNHPLRQFRLDWWPVANFDDSVYRTVAEEFPKFEPHLRMIQLFACEDHHIVNRFDAMMDDDDEMLNVEPRVRNLISSAACWGEVPSLQRQAALQTLRLISTRGCWSEKAWSDVYEGPHDYRDYQVPTTDVARDIFRYHSLYKPWTIVEDDADHDIGNDARHPAHRRARHKSQEEYDRLLREYPAEGPLRTRYFLSAASIAIHFLESNPAQRRNIRKIILDETRPCQGYSECHGLGLIKFCKENPMLRVERRANLWRNIWQTDDSTEQYRMNYPRDGMSQWDLTELVALWVVEALALVPAGMPPGAFTLVLDGSPAPERCAELFQRVHRDAAWQAAFDECLDRGLLPETAYHDRRRVAGYSFEGFPQALRDISRGTCHVVSANFDIGEPWDVEAMIEAHRNWDREDWRRKWELEICYQTAPPLPEWFELLKEKDLPGVTYWR